MQGNRVPDETLPIHYKHGDYGRYEGSWWGLCPKLDANLICWLPKHQIVEHEDGIITVSPSILCGDSRNQWHGYLERGVWREC